MPDRDRAQPALVGDVGGTNCRLGLAARTPGARPRVSHVRTYRGADFPGLEDAVRTYLAAESAKVSAAVIAVAGPVADGAVQMTNHPWRITEAGLSAALGGAPARLLNDFEALAHALPALGGEDLAPLGDAPAAAPRGAMAVMGAGTGFGAAALVRNGPSQAVLVAEAGHMAFAPGDAVEIEVLRYLARRFGYVQVEHVLSGPGLLNLHRVLCEIAGAPMSFETPDAITEAADAGDPRALAVIDRFVAIFGGVAGDLALAQGARGGVFIAGGVSQRVLSARNAVAFRARFEAKGAFSPYVQAIPTQLITHDQPGLLGAACALAALAP